jgi:phytanoyl-CoA hydroxylase
MLMTDAQLTEYYEQGFVVLDHVFTSEEMAELAVLIEGHHKAHEERLQKSGTEGISRAGEIAFTSHLAEQNPELLKFVRRPEFVAITTKVLGPDVDLYWNQSVYKEGHGDAEFPWHQDDGYTPVDPSPYLTLWLAVSDATLENGCLSVLPRSHERGLVPHSRTAIGLACHALTDPDQGVPVPIPTGTMIAMQSLTFHKSGVNRSDAMRKAYVIQYSVAGLRDARTGEVLPDKKPVARHGLSIEAD